MRTNPSIALSYDSLGIEVCDEIRRTFPDVVKFIHVNNPEQLRSGITELDEITTLTKLGNLGLILDTQLAGGTEALRFRTEKIITYYSPRFITVASGVSVRGIERVVRTARTFRNEPVGVLVTGVLPELTPRDLSTASHYTMDPARFTEDQAKVAVEADAAGVYGAAHDAGDSDLDKDRLLYVATGISPDGTAYADKYCDNVATIKEAFALGAKIVVVGSSLSEERYLADTVQKKVDLFSKMIEGSFVK